MRDGGFDDEGAARWVRSLSDFLGQAMLEGAFVALPPEVQAADLGAWRDLPVRLPQDGTPHADAAAPYLRTLMVESSFEDTLALILRGLAATPRRALLDQWVRLADCFQCSGTPG